MKIKVNLDKNERVETGVLQVNDDWPGIYVRGDAAMWYSFLLNRLLNGENLDPFALGTLKHLADLLGTCEVKNERD